LAVGLIAGFGTWYYCYAIFIPAWKADNALFQLTWSNRSDLYPRWLGTRELLLQHRDPYGPQVTRDIQIGYYGRPVGDGYEADPQGFVYPLYVVWLLAPTIWTSFSNVRVLFSFLLLIAAAVSVPLWFRALGLQYDRTTLVLVEVFTLASWPVVQGIAVQQFTLLVGLLLAGALAALARENLRICGVLLALATIKPQLSLPIIAWTGVWAAMNWHKRRAVIGSFGITLLTLFLSAELVERSWLMHWRSSWSSYLNGTKAKLPLQMLLGDTLGVVCTGAIIVLVAAVCVRRAREEAGSTALAPCHALVAAATLAVFPTWYMNGYNQILLIPAVIWLILGRPPVEQRRPAFVVFRWVTLAAVAWPTAAALGLTVAAWLLRPKELSFNTISRLPFYDFLAIPLLVIAALLLFSFSRDLDSRTRPIGP
jgi:hypothetical protein